MRGIFIAGTCYNCTVNQFCSLLILTCTVMWGLYVDYHKSVVNYLSKCGRHIFSGAYVSNVKCMYTIAHGDIVDCIEFM